MSNNRWIERLGQDVFHTFRLMKRNPGFSAWVVIPMGLAAGIATAVFSLAEAFLLRPLPVKEPSTLVALWNGERLPSSPPEYLDYRTQATSLTDFAAYREGEFNVAGVDEPLRLRGARVTSSFFPATGATPVAGRLFGSEADVPGRRVVVLSDGSARRLFGGPESAIGRNLMLDGAPHQVVAVVRSAFRFPPKVEIWAPLAFERRDLERRYIHNLSVIARLKPGVSLASAREEARLVAARMAEQNPQSYNSKWTARLVPLQQDLTRRVQPTLLVLILASSVMLIMGSVNVASLFITRALERQKEFGTRHALGAPQGRLIFQALVESAAHGLTAGLAGIAFAYVLIRSLTSMLPDRLGYVPEFGLNLTVVAFALAAALFTSVLFGIVPAFHTTSGGLTELLKEGGRSSSMGARGRRWQSAMVCAELALTFVLLVGAGLAVRTFIHLSNVDMGFDPNNLLTAKIALPEASYRDPVRRNLFVNSIEEHIRSVPGIIDAAAVNTAPFTGPLSSIGISLEGKELPVGKTAAEPDVLVVTPQFFSTLRTRIVNGRLFAETDHRNSTPVVVVDDVLAASLWGNANPLKQRIKFGPIGSDNTWMEVVGVVRHIKQDYEEGGIRPQIYQPYSQAPTSAIVFVARARSNAAALIPTLRRAINEVDPTRPVYDMREMTSLMGDEGARYRLNVTVMSAFGGLSLVLGCVGLYGVLAYSVRTRQQEIGIRVALGASQSQIRSLVLRDGLRLTLIGLVIGFLLAFVLGRLMIAALVGVAPLDTVTYGITLTVLAVVALVATLLPAMRASSLDPSTVLRNG